MRYDTKVWALKKSDYENRVPSAKQIKLLKEAGKNNYTTIRGMPPEDSLWSTSFHFGSENEVSKKPEPKHFMVPYSSEDVLVLTKGVVPEFPSQPQTSLTDSDLVSILSDCVNDLIDINNNIHFDIYMDPEAFKTLYQKFKKTKRTYNNLKPLLGEEHIHPLLQNICLNVQKFFESESARKYLKMHDLPEIIEKI